MKKLLKFTTVTTTTLLRSILLLLSSCLIPDSYFEPSIFGSWEAYTQGNQISIHEDGSYEWHSFIFAADHEADVYVEIGTWELKGDSLGFHPSKSECKFYDKNFKFKLENNELLLANANDSIKYSRIKFSFLAMESFKTTYHCSL